MKVFLVWGLYQCEGLMEDLLFVSYFFVEGQGDMEVGLKLGVWFFGCGIASPVRIPALPFAMTEGEGVSGVGVVTVRKFDGTN